jgi:hypothetical protein
MATGGTVPASVAKAQSEAYVKSKVLESAQRSSSLGIAEAVSLADSGGSANLVETEVRGMLMRELIAGGFREREV